MSEPVDRDALERERDFLLKSLDDLDAERAAGNIDPQTYETLHSDYTARAAAVLRSLRDDSDEPVVRVAAPPVPLTRRVLVWSLIIVFIGVASALLVRTLSDRDAGEPLTGDVPSLTGGEPTGVTAAPGAATEFDRLLALGNDLRAQALAAQPADVDLVLEALATYDDAVAADPQRSEALAERGWLLRILSTQVRSNDPQLPVLLDRAEESLRGAMQIRDRNVAKYAYAGIFLCRDRGESEAAAEVLRQFLSASPDNPMANMVGQVLADAEAGRCEPRVAPADSVPQSTTTTTP